ncbi:MAG: DNA helicase RecG, partial [Chloroflexi bacterium]|nr:DNA helicase RecG [Chloroflexota bacterium]
LRKEVQAGRQGFVICPLVEESETIESKAATEEYRRLSQEVFTDLRLGLLHGRMSAKDKDSVMRQFRDGDLDILVSTAVVEVGIDVANATVMLIEGADRFGLAQLHQFRGRVGRGEHKSYCLLLSDTQSEVAKERLSALERIHDGFQLAEVDLELRGPGDFFGTRQSGLPNLRMAHLSDRNLLELARDEASRLREQDPDLAAAEHAALAARVNRFLDQVSTEAS